MKRTGLGAFGAVGAAAEVTAGAAAVSRDDGDDAVPDPKMESPAGVLGFKLVLAFGVGMGRGRLSGFANVTLG